MRSADIVADALGRTTRYGRCGRREQQAFSQASTHLAVPAGAVLAHRGSVGREFAIVLTGAAVATAGRQESALLAGDHFGDVALLDAGPNPATVVAATPMTLAVVGPSEFSIVLERCPTIARAVLDGLAGRLRATVSAAERYVPAESVSSARWNERDLAFAAR
jgi:CRP/FNR family transcriptional regulator, cyclic AMP receptor protein